MVLSAHLIIEGYEKEISEFVIERLEEKAGGRLKINIDTTDLDLFSQSICIHGLEITPVPGKIKKAGIHARIKELNIKGISLWNLLVNKKLNANHIDIQAGYFQITRPNGETIAVIPDINGNLQQAKLGKRMSFKTASLELKSPEFHPRDGFYRLSAETIKVYSSEFSVIIKGLRLTPRYQRYEFSRKKGYMCNRLEFFADKISGVHLDINRLLSHREIFFREVMVSGPRLDIFRNRKMRRKPGKRKDIFPRHMLARIRVPFSIERLNIDNGELDYTVLTPEGRLPGSIILKDIDMVIENLTNHPHRIEEKAILKLSASTSLMGTGKFLTRIRVPLHKSDNSFAVNGSLGAMNPAVMNRLLTRTANIRIDRGKLDSMTFSMQGNHHRVSGEMKLRYRDLKISLLKRGGSYKRRWFFSFLANRIIPADNPKSGKPLRVGRILYIKEMPVSFFTYIGKALLTGLKSSTRLKRRKQ